MPTKKTTRTASVRLPEELHKKLKESPLSHRQLLELALSPENITKFNEAIRIIKDIQKEIVKTQANTIKDERKAHQVELRAEQKAHEKERIRLTKEALKTKNPIVKLIKPPASPKAPKQPRLPALCPHGHPKGSCLICHNDRKAEMKRKEEERSYIRNSKWLERERRERQRALHRRSRW